MPAPAGSPKKEAQGPRIPEHVLDFPTQRLYSLSFGLLCQAIKIFDFFRYLLDPTSSRYALKWLVVDTLYLTTLAAFRIPRLNYTKAVVLLQILSMCMLDGFLFGGITVNVGVAGSWKIVPGIKWTSSGEATSTAPGFSLTSLIPGLGLGALLGLKDPTDSHLLGQHTVRMSPISTAHLNPYAQTFCLSSPGEPVLIPLLLNNTIPTNVKYTLTPLGYVDGNKDKKSPGKVEHLELSPRDLKAIEQSRLDSLQLARTSAPKDEYDEYDYDDEDEDSSSPHSSLLKSQTLAHLKVSKPGILRLERVLDSSGIDARMIYPTEIPIVPCPKAVFSPSSAIVPTLTHNQSEANVRCANPGLKSGVGEEVEVGIEVSGVPPLSLRWSKDVNGRKESFMVEGIESEADDKHTHVHGQSGGEQSLEARFAYTYRSPSQLTVPLTLTLDALGTHTYTLESISDGLGNTIHLTGPSHPLVDIRREVTVLRRPSVSFKHCSPSRPASLSVGGETSLEIGVREADDEDAPYSIEVAFAPAEGNSDEEGLLAKAKSTLSKPKPWTKTFSTRDERRHFDLDVNVPGEYAITKVKGRYCEGDVLAPDTCPVHLRPLPNAELSWRGIHECSGDTGVQATLTFHGTPPFTFFYTISHNHSPPKELSKTFSQARGELTIQPERSGHYEFRGVAISDANYKRIPVGKEMEKGIEQVVRPPASADWAHNAHGGRGRKRLSSCGGDEVDLGVELRGTGPWTLEVQVVSQKSSETIKIPNIQDSRNQLHVPIPAEINKEGGSFEVDLVSVEDAYGCKRPISVPGVQVNVKRIKPTVKFYGAKSQRKVTVLEGERAALPLRLTGDGPWRVKYVRTEFPDRVYSAALSSPNDELHVTGQGTYELVEISDAQCPGLVVRDSSSYIVDWVPRPSAKLSNSVVATYEPYNGSYILPPICEGLNDHVDLDLVGKPPFQIMYNVARDSESGGTKILAQPTFSSIQPRTRFQLHTSDPARIYYEVKQIGDAAYPLEKHRDAVIPRNDRLLFEQLVLGRPSARFRNRNRLTYCLNDEFVPHAAVGDGSGDGVLLMKGLPPFTVTISIRNLAASSTHTEVLTLHENGWKLNLPSYSFASIGPHLVTIEDIQDASGCAQATPDAEFRSIWVDVAETAAIVPFDRREHFCVGDVSMFQLEGTPPWTIGYKVNGKTYTSTAKVSPFSIHQSQPGSFAVTSIAHQQKLCKTSVTDLQYTIHPLPSAQVGHGKRIVQDIHEGDQAEIVFTLVGEPPFTFTYQRAELPGKKGKEGKVLETHTVSGVTTNEYSIYSALEGTWTVTFISDRYCRYPPAQPDGSGDKSR